MPIFTVDNYTLYNTDDILALFELVEEAVEDLEGAARPNYCRRWQVQGERLGLRVTIKDYNPTGEEREVRTHVNGMSRVEKHRLSVKVAATPTTDLRIVTPDRLWSSPIEALAASNKGNNTVPDYVVKDLVERIGHLYEVTRYGNKRCYVEPDCSGHKLRFENSAAKKIDAEERARAARQNAISAYNDALYAKGQADKYAENIKNATERAIKHIRRAKVPLGERENDLLSALDAFLRCSSELDRTLRAAKVER